MSILGSLIVTNTNKGYLKFQKTRVFNKDLKQKVIHEKNLNRNLNLKGKIIGIYMLNPLDVIYNILLFNELGATVMPIFKGMPEDLLRKLIINYKINFILSDKPLKLDESKTLKYNRNYLYVNDNQKIRETLDDVPIILLSSGTTGIPKAICITEENIINVINAITEYIKPTPIDKILVIKDITHSSTLIGEVFFAIRNGLQLEFSQSYPILSHLTQEIVDGHFTILFGVPLALQVLCGDQYFLGDLRLVHISGEILNKELIKKFFSLYKKIDLFYAYGLTEAAPRVAVNHGEDLFRHPLSVGKLLDYDKGFINNPHRECVMGKLQNIGELCIQGPNVMKGYLNSEGKIKRESILKTGDIAYFDTNNFLYILGRKDNMFIKHGENIYPEEIENALLHVTGITDALVCYKKGKIEASIVSNIPLTQLQIKKKCQKYLPIFKIPQIINFVDKIPLNRVGKKRRTI